MEVFLYSCSSSFNSDHIYLTLIITQDAARKKKKPAPKKCVHVMSFVLWLCSQVFAISPGHWSFLWLFPFRFLFNTWVCFEHRFGQIFVVHVQCCMWCVCVCFFFGATSNGQHCNNIIAFYLEVNCSGCVCPIVSNGLFAYYTRCVNTLNITKCLVHLRRVTHCNVYCLYVCAY